MIKFVCTLITVSDMNRSVKFYVDLLGQNVLHDFGENVMFSAGFALHLRSHFRSLIGDRQIQHGGNNFELYFETENIHVMSEKLNSNQVQMIHDVIEQPWRQKVLRFYDPDNNIIEIGEPMRITCRRLQEDGLSTEEICRATGMELHVVREFLEDKHSSSF
jgi:catechol 2,3-dioxygenase-like lactoylglutathione lyase family enzyme